MACKYRDICPSYSGWCNSPNQNYESCVDFLITAYENEKQKNGNSDWIYHIPEENFGIVDFDIIEKALGFKLFAWQKSYILSKGHQYRRSGKTTAEILCLLLNDVDDEPIDFSDFKMCKLRAKVYISETRKIWEKLNAAGIRTRTVIWNKQDKERGK